MCGPGPSLGYDSAYGGTLTWEGVVRAGQIKTDLIVHKKSALAHPALIKTAASSSELHVLTQVCQNCKIPDLIKRNQNLRDVGLIRKMFTAWWAILIKYLWPRRVFAGVGSVWGNVRVGRGWSPKQHISAKIVNGWAWPVPGDQSMNETTRARRGIVNTETVGIHNVYFIQWIDSFLD